MRRTMIRLAAVAALALGAGAFDANEVQAHTWDCTEHMSDLLTCMFTDDPEVLAECYGM